jgi:peptide/nickel transport system permease protein
MFGYIIRRIFQLIPVLIGISFITFALSFIVPGDPVRVIMGQRSDREIELRIREKFGLDRPWYVQYLMWVRNLVRNPGDPPQFSLRAETETGAERFQFKLTRDTVYATDGIARQVSDGALPGLEGGRELNVEYDSTSREAIDGMFDAASQESSDVRQLRSPVMSTIVAKERSQGRWFFTLEDSTGNSTRVEMMPNAILLLGGNRAYADDFVPGMIVFAAYIQHQDTQVWAVYDDSSKDLPAVAQAAADHPESRIVKGTVSDVVLTPAVWFDFGRSYRQQREVRDIIHDSFKNTAYLSSIAMLIAILVGITAGIISAVRPYSVWDYLTMTGALLGVSMPVFWLGLMLILLFQGELHWVSGVGYGQVHWIPINLGLFTFHLPWHQQVILPAVTLSTVPMAIIARMTRSSMLEVLNLDYVRTARAKGLSEWAVIMRHALKNALIPIITVIGVDFALLLAGAVLTETVFSWPGLGREIVDAIEFRDFPVVMGGVVLFAFVFVFVNLLVDILYAYVDPRIRYQ